MTFPTIPRLARLLRRFSPSLVLLDAAGPHPIRTGSGSTLVLVGRGLSLFLDVDASAVPQKQRKAFVALQVRRAAPFADADHDIVWFNDHAAVWYWSRSRIAALLDLPASRVRFRAEASYRGEQRSEDCVELLALGADDGLERDSAGYEGRHWRQGRLVGSRWWPTLPGEVPWQTFLRGSGLGSAASVPAPVHAGLREQPLGGMLGGAWSGQLRAHWPMLAAATGSVVLLSFTWQLAGIARAQHEISQTEQRVAALERRLDTIISARTRADDASANIGALLSLRPPVSQTRLMGEIARITPGTGWQVMLWQQSSPEVLEVTLRGNLPDATTVVSAWEQSAYLWEVTPGTSTRSDELTLRARLVPSAPETES